MYLLDNERPSPEEDVSPVWYVPPNPFMHVTVSLIIATSRDSVASAASSLSQSGHTLQYISFILHPSSSLVIF